MTAYKAATGALIYVDLLTLDSATPTRCMSTDPSASWDRDPVLLRPATIESKCGKLASVGPCSEHNRLGMWIAKLQGNV